MTKDSDFVGVFDSGVGGLSLLKELIKNHPHQSFVYLGDTARLPYGAKSEKTIESYVQRNIQFLKNRHQLKAIVVACNSASTILDKITVDLPIYGVIEAGVKAALKSHSKSLGLWATKATVRSNAYQRKLSKLAPSINLEQIASSCLVSMVEEGLDHPLYEPAFKYYLSLFKKPIDGLILGCTHFPLFKERLKTYLTKTKQKIQLIDASSELSQEISSHCSKSGKREISLLLTDHTPHFEAFVKSIMPKDQTFHLEIVDL